MAVPRRRWSRRLLANKESTALTFSYLNQLDELAMNCVTGPSAAWSDID